MSTKLRKPRVSIVILNYNGKTYLGNCLFRCLSSVLKTNYDDFDVIFFDNGSTDNSVEYVQKMLGKNTKLKIVKNSKNLGFAQGNNLAITHASGDYIVLLNSDVEVENNWLLELVKVMENDPTIGIAQSKILDFDRIHIQTVGNLLDASLDTYLIGHNQIDNGQYDKICEITYASGATLITRRSLIEKIGLFDSNYFFYHDDCDLGWRARIAGYRVVFVPSSIVYHRGEATSSLFFKKNEKYLYYHCSCIGLLLKNFELKNLPKFGTIMLINIAMDFMGLIQRGDTKTLNALMIWTVKNFKQNWKKRLMIQKRIRQVSDEKVLKYFIGSSLLIPHKMRRNLNVFKGNRIHDNFDKIVNLMKEDYYRKHSEK